MHQNYGYGSLASYLNPADVSLPVDWATVFGRKAALEVEIGFGTGEYIVGLAERFPERNFIGLEQSAKRIIKTLRKIHDAGLGNIRLLQIDAAWAFEYFFAAGSLDMAHCLFPCPWPKTKHAKHRLFQPAFLQMANYRLVKGGKLRFVTDHAPYAEWILNGADGSGFSVSRRKIPPSLGTKFEKKWAAAGQREFDELVFVKTADIVLPEQRVETMKTYFLDKINPAGVHFGRMTGDISIQFKDFVFDAERSRGMVLAVVVESGRTQYLWISIARTSKDWCLRVAPGCCLLPTEGVRRALDMAYEAFLASAAEVGEK